MDDVAARIRLDDDAVRAPHPTEGRDRTGQEVPAGNRGEPAQAAEGGNVGDARVELVTFTARNATGARRQGGDPRARIPRRQREQMSRSADP